MTHDNPAYVKYVPTAFEAFGQPKLDEVLAPMTASHWWNGTDETVAHYSCMAMLDALVAAGFTVERVNAR